MSFFRGSKVFATLFVDQNFLKPFKQLTRFDFGHMIKAFLAKLCYELKVGNNYKMNQSSKLNLNPERLSIF